MEIADSNKLPFLSIMIEKKDFEQGNQLGNQLIGLVTSVYRKLTNNDLLFYIFRATWIH